MPDTPETVLKPELVERVARAIGEDERSRCGGTPYEGDSPSFNPWLTDGHYSAARAAIRAMPRTPSSATPDVRELVEQLRAGGPYVAAAATERAATTLETLEARVRLLTELVVAMDDHVSDCCGCFGTADEEMLAEMNKCRALDGEGE